MVGLVKSVAVGSLAVITALLLGACGVVQRPAISQPTTTPGYGSGPGVPGGMTGGGMGGMMSDGHMGGMMGGGGMMGSYGGNPSAPIAAPTPIGATPVPVDEEIQITAAKLRFVPAQITIRPGEAVRFVVTNNDSYLHNFVSEEAGIPLLTLPGNTTQTVTWTAPNSEGTYSALCTLHPGMTLTLIVND
jgi:plastocyanin